jgi:hypothetical protein
MLAFSLRPSRRLRYILTQKTRSGRPAPVKMLKMKVDPAMCMKTQGHTTKCLCKSRTFAANRMLIVGHFGRPTGNVIVRGGWVRAIQPRQVSPGRRREHPLRRGRGSSRSAGFQPAPEFQHFVRLTSQAGNHPQRDRSAPPESGGEIRRLPSSEEEGRRVSGRGGAEPETHKLDAPASSRHRSRQVAALPSNRTQPVTMPRRSAGVQNRV